MYKFLLALLLLFSTGKDCLLAEEVYPFKGMHYLATFADCDEQLINDPDRLEFLMFLAIRASGATILEVNRYDFEPQGTTIVFILSESHASIHTYPEVNGCFLDIFTCGNTCRPTEFHYFMKASLDPKKVLAEIWQRDDQYMIPLYKDYNEYDDSDD